MTVKIGIVGGAGVGAAHAIAARELGWDIAWVVDNNDEVLARYKGATIENHWAYIHESATLNEGIETATSIGFNLPHVDIALICSPNELHQLHYDQLFDNGVADKIFIEKPALLDTYHAIPTYFGYKCLQNPEVTEYLNSGERAPPQFIHFMHNYPPDHRKWDDDIIMDLGSHALSVLAYRWAYVFEGVEPKLEMYVPNGLAAFTVGDTQFIIAYKPKEMGISLNHISLDIDHVLENNLDLIVDGHAFAWPEDIFRTQLLSVLNSPPVFKHRNALIDATLLSLRKQVNERT